MTRSTTRGARLGRALGAALALLAAGPRGLANCETGAYSIHTVAEYAELDGAGTWLFRTGLRDGELELAPVATETEMVIWRLHRLLTSDDGAAFRVELRGAECFPDLSTVRLLRSAERMDGLVLRLTPCGPLPDEDGVAVYERDRRRLRFPVPLAVQEATPSDAATLAEGLRARSLELGLRLLPAAPAISAGDVVGVEARHTRIGDAGFWSSIVVLRLRNLERLFDGGDGGLYLAGGYLERSAVRDRFGDFPVIFFRWPGSEPVYVGDGSWCAGYRFGMEESRRQAGEVGALDRFVPRRAWDDDGDGLPDLLEIVGGVPEAPGGVLYSLTADPAAPLRVVDYPMGC